MKLKNFLSEPVGSILHFSFYKEVPGKSMKHTAAYLAYLGLLFTIAQVAAFRLRFAPALNEAVEWAAQNMPALTFKNGTASSDAPGPLRLHPPHISRVLIIDTARTDAVSAEEMKKGNAAGWLTQNAFYVATADDEMQVLDLSKTKAPTPLVVDAAFYRESGRALGWFLYPLAGIAGWFLFFCWKLAAGWAYAFLGLIFNAGTSAGLTYDSLYKISIYAQTPVILLQAVALFAAKNAVGFILIAWFLVGYYTWHAVRANRAPAPASA